MNWRSEPNDFGRELASPQPRALTVTQPNDMTNILDAAPARYHYDPIDHLLNAKGQGQLRPFSNDS